jgi:hypothetical protein
VGACSLGGGVWILYTTHIRHICAVLHQDVRRAHVVCKLTIVSLETTCARQPHKERTRERGRESVRERARERACARGREDRERKRRERERDPGVCEMDTRVSECTHTHRTPPSRHIATLPPHPHPSTLPFSHTTACNHIPYQIPPPSPPSPHDPLCLGLLLVSVLGPSPTPQPRAPTPTPFPGKQALPLLRPHVHTALTLLASLPPRRSKFGIDVGRKAPSMRILGF